MEEQHHQLRAEFSVAEAELKRTIAERETDVREMERGRDSALEDAKEERRVMLSIKEQMIEETNTREEMTTHLKEAGNNLLRLKSIVTSERDKRIRAEQKFKEVSDRRHDEEQEMKRELQQREEQHKSDLILLEEVRTQHRRSTHRADTSEELCREGM